MADLDASIREHLTKYAWDERPAGYDDGLHAALIAVLDMHAMYQQHGNHSLRQTAEAIAEALGIEVK